MSQVLSSAAEAFLKSKLRNIPDFPKPGIQFKDITPLLADARAFQLTLDAMTHAFLDANVQAVVGIESRGFIFGAPLAVRLGCSFVPVRKPGKLPYATDKLSYDLEYGSAELEMHTDALQSGARTVIVDDLLATGGTAGASAKLVMKQGGVVIAYAFAVELDFLNGRDRLIAGTPDARVESLLHMSAGE